MVVFDTLKASRRLRDAGFEEEKAEALVDAFAEDIGSNLATKNDLALLEQRLTLRIALAIGGATTVLLAAIGIVAGIIVSRL